MDGEPSSILAPTYRIFRDKHGIPQFSPKRGTQALLDAISYAFPNLETELQLMQAALRKFFDAERGSKFVFELRQNDLQISLTKPKAKDAKPFPSECSKDSLKNWKSRERGQRRGSRAGSRASSRPPSRPPSRALSRVSSRAGENPLTRPETPSDLNAGRMTTWVLSSGQELEGRKKAPYDPVKRRKVAENRGNVCEKHRVSKTMMSDFLRGFSRPFLANFRQCDPELCPDNKAYVKPVDVSKDIGDRGGFNSLPTVEETKMAQSGQVIPTYDLVSFVLSLKLTHSLVRLLLLSHSLNQLRISPFRKTHFGTHQQIPTSRSPMRNPSGQTCLLQTATQLPGRRLRQTPNLFSTLSL